jgi:uncharacterized membrane protein
MSIQRFPKFRKEAQWKAGFIYWNPDDPSILVPKRSGLGLTFNFANKWSWLAIIGILAAALIPHFFLRNH